MQSTRGTGAEFFCNQLIGITQAGSTFGACSQAQSGSGFGVESRAEIACRTIGSPVSSLHRKLKQFKQPQNLCRQPSRPLEINTDCPSSTFPVSALPDAEGSKDGPRDRGKPTHARNHDSLGICPMAPTCWNSNFARFRRTRFSTSLKQFLLADLGADIVARLIENGGYEARLTERYRELLSDLELRLVSSLSTPAPRAAQGQAKAATP